MMPLVDRSWHYGNAAQTSPVGGDFISDPAGDPRFRRTADEAFSLVLSPEDVLLNMTLARFGGRAGSLLADVVTGSAAARQFASRRT